MKPRSVGLTGGLASGKSAVAGLLAELGAAILDADEVVARLYRPGRPGARAVAAACGPPVLDAAGAVDREALAARVTDDPQALAQLNAAIHPLVHREVEGWLAGLADRDDPPRVAVVEAALMIETGSYRRYDLLAVVWCRPEQQLARATARGMPEARARALMAAQLPLARKRELADLVVDNSGPLDELAAEVRRIWPRLVLSCDARRAPGGAGAPGAG